MSTDFKLPDITVPDLRPPSGLGGKVKRTVNNINSTVNDALDPIFNNDMFAAVLSICLVLFASLIAPTLPTKITKVLQTPYFRTGVLFSVLYVSTKNVALAALVSGAYFVTTIEQVKSLVWRMTKAETFVTSDFPDVYLNELGETLAQKIEGQKTEAEKGQTTEAQESEGSSTKKTSTSESGTVSEEQPQLKKRRNFNPQSVLATWGDESEAIPSGELASVSTCMTTEASTTTKEPLPWDTLNFAEFDPKLDV